MDAKLAQVFEHLDRWRHLPNYQLERRADIFFSVYLKDLIEKKFDTSLLNVIIPEFPLQRHLVLEKVEPSKRSVKVDYVLFSEDRKFIYFIELKTDCGSFDPIQAAYLQKAAGVVKFPALLDGLNEIIQSSKFSGKYASLVQILLDAGILLPNSPDALSMRNVIRCNGINYEIAPCESTIKIIYILPRESKLKSSEVTYIYFKEIIEFLALYPDDLSKRFATSLAQWQRDAGLSVEALDNEQD